jgi:hypothetical protein
LRAGQDIPVAQTSPESSAAGDAISTKHGLSFALGKGDLTATLDETLAKPTPPPIDWPVNADFEAGFADHASGVAANIAARQNGVAGLSIVLGVSRPEEVWAIVTAVAPRVCQCQSQRSSWS